MGQFFCCYFEHDDRFNIGLLTVTCYSHGETGMKRDKSDIDWNRF